MNRAMIFHGDAFERHAGLAERLISHSLLMLGVELCGQPVPERSAAEGANLSRASMPGIGDIVVIVEQVIPGASERDDQVCLRLLVAGAVLLLGQLDYRLRLLGRQ